jgi:hypothetical protein
MGQPLVDLTNAFGRLEAAETPLSLDGRGVGERVLGA